MKQILNHQANLAMCWLPIVASHQLHHSFLNHNLTLLYIDSINCYVAKHNDNRAYSIFIFTNK